MLIDPNRSEAERRVDQACRQIASAYRLYDLDPADTIFKVKSAIIEGAQDAADDIRAAVEALPG